uniref:Uncharacterized protein n=1 Tax=Angiostrongylus cantonensis TaxID=6313 RepID=A0A0K0D815_ANGCA
MREILSRLRRRIESLNTFEEFTKERLESELSKARSEVDELQRRYESAGEARKALNEKLNDVLEERNETFLETRLRRLTLNTTCKDDENKKGEAKRSKERRRTRFMLSGAKSVLFEEEDESNEQPQGIVSGKEATLKDICDNQQGRPKQWILEKKLFIETESSLNARIKDLRIEKHALLEETKELQKQVELLSAKLSSSNDENCHIEQSAEIPNFEKLNLEDEFQGKQNENERLSTKLRSKVELVSLLGSIAYFLSILTLYPVEN